MSLHYARLKRVEDLPKDFFCCEERRNSYIKQLEKISTIDITKQVIRTLQCLFCFKNEHVYHTCKTIEGDFVILEILDIDESPIDASH